MPFRLFIFRHGETIWSRSGQYTGRTDLPLTEYGQEVARELGIRLRKISFTHVLASPLARALETCSLLDLGPTREIEPELTEWDNGDDESLTPAKILAVRVSKHADVIELSFANSPGV
jgi:probable phosphoglycerate mutase